MLGLRSSAAALLLVCASTSLAGCGESAIERKAREANDAVPTTSAAGVAAKEQALEKEAATLDKQDRKDRKGLAKDLVNAISGAADDAQKDAGKQAENARDRAAAAAQKAIDDAAAEADKIRTKTNEDAQAAASDVQDALSGATTP